MCSDVWPLGIEVRKEHPISLGLNKGASVSFLGSDTGGISEEGSLVLGGSFEVGGYIYMITPVHLH